MTGQSLSRGETYRLMMRYEEALTDFDRAIELNNDYAWAIAKRSTLSADRTLRAGPNRFRTRLRTHPRRGLDFGRAAKGLSGNQRLKRRAEINDLFTTLDKIKQSPGLYIGRPSVSNLFMFLIGYKISPHRTRPSLQRSRRSRFSTKTFNLGYRKSSAASPAAGKAPIMLSCHDEKAEFSEFFSAHGRVHGPGRSTSRVTRWSKKIHHPSSELHPPSPKLHYPSSESHASSLSGAENS